ncbi:hypothetical protein D6C95_09241 [Aureobasidium pullulans]|nr:hypothetical protein D6C95_09241 [Aureobasidium pullulans]
MQSYKKKTVLNAQYSDILSASNCSTLTCLRSLSEEALTNAIDASYEIGYAQGLYTYGDFYHGPAVDGRIIQDLPSRELEAGNSAKTTLKLYTLWPSAGSAFYRRIDQLYPVGSFAGSFFNNPFFNSTIISFLSSSHISGLSANSIFWRTQAIYGDFIINCPTYQLATAFSDAGLPVYKMIFRASTQIHGASATFLNSPAPLTQDPELAAKMQDY